MALLSYHPFKAIYTVYSIILALLTSPIWLTKSIVPWTRPSRAWTLRQAVRMQVVSKVLHYWALIELNTPTPLKPRKEGRRFTIAYPANDELYVGPLDDDEIRPQPVGLTWTRRPISKETTLPKDATIVLHFHGGAFVIGDGRDHDTGFAASTLIKHFGATTVITPQYRLSCRPGARFPAALQDSVTSYLHLVHDIGINPKQIIIAGDSAGGNLALGLLRYIQEHGGSISGSGSERVPLPGAVLLWSPWTDVSTAQDPQAIYQSPQYHTDYLTGAFGSWGARAYLASTEKARREGIKLGSALRKLDAMDPYISPLHSPFRSEIPMWIHAGSGEVLIHDCEELHKRFSMEQIQARGSNLVEVDGKSEGQAKQQPVEIMVSPHCPHDILLVGALTGFKTEAQDAARQAGQFWRDVRNMS